MRDFTASCLGRVLIVEDDPKNMKLFTAMITSQGYEAIPAETGYEGIDLAHVMRPDLIVMDIRLPDISGLLAIKLLKQADDVSHIPILATTAHIIPELDQQSLLRTSGCDAFMAKPIAVADFITLLNKLMPKRAELPIFPDSIGQSRSNFQLDAAIGTVCNNATSVCSAPSS